MMDNPFTHSRVVTGESFCNRQQELRDLAYYVQTIKRCCFILIDARVKPR